MLDRCSYQPSDIQLNEKFRPVVRRASDGMLTVNFAAFDLLSSTGVPHICATVVATLCVMLSLTDAACHLQQQLLHLGWRKSPSANCFGACSCLNRLCLLLISILEHAPHYTTSLFACCSRLCLKRLYLLLTPTLITHPTDQHHQ